MPGRGHADRIQRRAPRILIQICRALQDLQNGHGGIRLYQGAVQGFIRCWRSIPSGIAVARCITGIRVTIEIGGGKTLIGRSRRIASRCLLFWSTVAVATIIRFGFKETKSVSTRSTGMYPTIGVDSAMSMGDHKGIGRVMRQKETQNAASKQQMPLWIHSERNFEKV
jgi:hypothetical protein